MRSQVSAKIADLFREDDLLGRIGGDKFVILIKNIPHSKTVGARAEAVCATAAAIYSVLELIGKYYRFNRVYIFEDSE